MFPRQRLITVYPQRRAPVWDRSAVGTNLSLHNGGTDAVYTPSGSGFTWSHVRSQALTSGKWYGEIKLLTRPAGGFDANSAYGIARADDGASSNPGSDRSAVFRYTYGGNGNLVAGSTFTNAIGSIVTAADAVNDVWGIAIDFAANKAWIAKNNVWFGSGDPAAGTNPWLTSGLTGQTIHIQAFAGNSNGNPNLAPSMRLQTSAYAAPSGFSLLL